MSKVATNPYDADFFERQRRESLASAQVIVPLVIECTNPKSVLDVGCGIGAWLKVFSDLGVPEVLGMDGDYVKPEELLIPANCFRATNLDQLGKAERTFDLAVCLEVAEHLKSESADALTSFLASSSNAILFSAAIPYQGGVKHINEQWPSYWVDRFSKLGFSVYDAIRPKILCNDAVSDWYRRNTLLFARPDAVDVSRFKEYHVHKPYVVLNDDILERFLYQELGLKGSLRKLPGLIFNAIRNRLPFREHSNRLIK